MGNVLWEWRFKAHGNNNDDVSLIDIDQGVYGDNVMVLPLKLEEIEGDLLIEVDLRFRDKIIGIIEQIMTLWKQDYLSLRKRYVCNRDLDNELVVTYERMVSEAFTISGTLDYIEGAQNRDFDEHFKLNAIGDMLDSFRQEVFSILESNERGQRS